MRPIKFFVIAVVIALFFLSACNLGKGRNTTTPPTIANVEVASDTPLPPATAEATPTETAIPAEEMPGEVPSQDPVYDSESASTANLKYAANGDLYDLNRFERPFTQTDMVYLPYIDIQKFSLSKDASWYYASVVIEDLGADPLNGLDPVYGIEVDYDFNGRGNLLILSKPPFKTTWDNKPVSIYLDRNGDVGGIRPEQSDPADKAGDGYEETILDAGHGDDPTLAWVRISPDDPNVLQFAFKQSLIPGKSFEWAAWADAGIKDPTKFSYNDRMTLAEAGSPMNKDPNYPLKGLFAVDNTCYSPFGAERGYLPMECPHEEVPTKRPPPPPPGQPTYTKPPQPTATLTRIPPPK